MTESSNTSDTAQLGSDLMREALETIAKINAPDFGSDAQAFNAAREVARAALASQQGGEKAEASAGSVCCYCDASLSCAACGREQPGDTAQDAEGCIDDIVTKLYRRFKDWSARGFGPNDVTWCEVKADIEKMIALRSPAEIDPVQVGKIVNKLHGERDHWVQETVNLERQLMEVRRERDQALGVVETSRAQAIEECAKVAEAQVQTFLSPQYAANQPFGSICERFACEEVAKAIRGLISSTVQHPPQHRQPEGDA